MSHFLEWISIPNQPKFNLLKNMNFSTTTFGWGTTAIRIIASAVIIVSIGGCGPQETQSEAVQKQKSPGYLRLPLKRAMTTLDPGLIFDLGQIEVVEQLFLGLTDFNPKTYEVVPELAKDWQVSQSGKVYTFRLRQDIKWSNGEPVTAHDLVWAIRRNVVKETDSPYVFTLYILNNAEAINQGRITDITKLGVHALDDYTVQFTLNQAAGYFPALASLWTYRPLPRNVIEQYGNNWTDPAHIQTNGSYQLTEWNKGERLILTKNPLYYEADSVNIPQVHYRIVPGDSLALALYKKNEIDIIGGQVYLQLPDKEISQIKSDPVLRQDRQILPTFCTEWYGFNTQRPPTDNLLVRKAIAAALDKKNLITFVLRGEQSPATTFTRPPVFGAVDSSEDIGIGFSPKQARAWLAKAGYPNGEGFPQLVFMYNASKTHTEVAKAVKMILKHYLNIDTEIRAIDFFSYIDTLKQSNKPHIFRMGWCADFPDAHYWLHELFHPNKGINWIGWNNREFAKWVDQAQQIDNQAQRQRLYRRAEQILTEEEVAIIPVFFSNSQWLVKPWVTDWYYMGFGGQHLRYWSLSNK